MLDCQPVSDQVAEAARTIGKVLIAAEDPDNFSQPEKGGRPHPALPHGLRARAHEGRAGVPAALELRAQLEPLEAGFEEGEEEPEWENLSYTRYRL